MIIVLDTETCYNDELTHVWLWGFVSDDCEKYGTNIESLCHELFHLPRYYFNIQIYFHNLKYDGHYLADAFLRRGMEYVEEGKEIKKTNQFTSFIDGTGNWYSITYMDCYRRKITIYDSLKKIPLSVQAIAKTYGLQDKGCIDYTEYKEVGYIPTYEEIDYCLNDCRIVHQALTIGETMGLNRMTIGSDCMAYYTRLCGGKKAFRSIFPNLDTPHPQWVIDKCVSSDVSRNTIDSYCRRAYKGAFCYVNPKFKGQKLGNGLIYDVNSLYPSVMRNNPYPIGLPDFGYGEPDWADGYGYIFRCIIKFDLKPNGVPCIIERNHCRFMSASSWVGSSGDESLEMYFTHIDYELIKQNYYYEIEFLDYMKFEMAENLFTKYIDYWNSTKEQASREGNKGLRQIAKLYNNHLYGKFGQNNDTDKKGLAMVDDVVTTYDTNGKERETIYVPVAAFCTAYARYVTISAVQANYDRFCYADTDSIHIIGTEPADGIEIDDVKLGAWKCEGEFTSAKYLRQKTYIETVEGKLQVTCAGFKKAIVIDGQRYDRNEYYSEVLGLGYDDFKLPDDGGEPLVIPNGRTNLKRIKGGVIITNADFTLW